MEVCMSERGGWRIHTAADLFQKYNSEYCQILFDSPILTITIQHFLPFGTKLEQCVLLSQRGFTIY